MSTAPRSTASLAVPSTQNTAPIFEFRCLYTHDIRQKKKRWQDGILRFHTFNKRVMVYDLPRNYIGDTHSRDDHPVQDGDELSLDKGVLVQVGEMVGTTEQDLTDIRAKRRQLHGDSPAKVATPRLSYPATPHFTATPLSQLRPKSLNTLLGVPRGAYGRATLPSKSPFENRHAAQAEHPEKERPAKRQRLSTEQELEEVAPWNRENKHKFQDVLPRFKNGKPSILAAEQRPIPADIVTIESDDENSAPPRNVTGKSLASARHNPIGSPNPRPCVAKINQAHPRTREPPDSEEVVSGLRRSSAVDQQRSLTEIPAPQDDGEQRPQNMLRVASRKPRRRLMYRDLLPERPPSGVTDALRNCDKIVQEGSRKSKSRRTPEQANDLHRFAQRQRVELECRLQRSAECEKQVEWNSLSASPMHSSQHSPEVKQRTKRLRTANISSTKGAEESALPRTICNASSEHALTGNGPDALTESLFLNQEPQKEFDPATELERMDNILLVRPDRPLTANNKDKISDASNFGQQNCRAESILLTARDPKITSVIDPPPNVASLREFPAPKPGPHGNTAFKQPTKNAPLPQPTVAAPTTRRLRPRSPLKKALTDSVQSTKVMKSPSDNRALQRATSDITSRSSPAAKQRQESEKARIEAQDADVGPWSREAFDLFGWNVGDSKTLVDKGTSSKSMG